MLLCTQHAADVEHPAKVQSLVWLLYSCRFIGFLRLLMAPSGMLSIAKAVISKKATNANTPRPEHPLCAMFWHICTRQPHVFEYVLWTLWLLTLAFWASIFVLVVHFGATQRRTQQSRCILDAHCACLKETPTNGSEISVAQGRGLHALSFDDLTAEALKLGFTKSELEKQQDKLRGSPKEVLVQLILGPLPRSNRAALELDEEMAAVEVQPQGATPAASKDY